jgi:hypothetical protein
MKYFWLLLRVVWYPEQMSPRHPPSSTSAAFHTASKLSVEVLVIEFALQT